MDIQRKNALWKAAFGALYETSYLELAGQALISRWERVHLAVVWLVAATALGSGIAGWSLWTTPAGKVWWALIAGLATFSSIGHGSLGVASRMRFQDGVRSEAAQLRIDIESFRHILDRGEDISDDRLDALLTRYKGLVGRVGRDLAFTKKLANRIQDELDELMRKKKYI